MTATQARCRWCDTDRAIDPRGVLTQHRIPRGQPGDGQTCKGSGRHKDTRPRPHHSGALTLRIERAVGGGRT